MAVVEEAYSGIIYYLRTNSRLEMAASEGAVLSPVHDHPHQRLIPPSRTRLRYGPLRV